MVSFLSEVFIYRIYSTETVSSTLYFLSLLFSYSSNKSSSEIDKSESGTLPGSIKI